MKTFLIIYGVIALIHALYFILQSNTRFGVAAIRAGRLNFTGLWQYYSAIIDILGSLLWPVYWIVTIALFILIHCVHNQKVTEVYENGNELISQYLE